MLLGAYCCDECQEVDAPDHMTPLSVEEGRLLTSCEACGGWFHPMCGYDLPTRKYLLAGPGAPMQRVNCKACYVVWTQDPYNLNQAAMIIFRRYKVILRKMGEQAKEVLSSSKTCGGSRQVRVSAIRLGTAS